MQVNKKHLFCRTPYGFQMSQYMQDITLFMGQACVFEEGEKIIKRLTGAEVSAKQIERIIHAYGELLEAGQTKQEDELKPKQESLHHAMMDGGMIYTREDDWKEMKLARIFEAESLLPENEKRNFIRQSKYLAHLGGVQGFFRKLCAITDHLANMVWIADGATWIWKWVEENYPGSIQILDYFHCKEKLCGFAAEAFPDQIERKQWVQQQEDLLFQDQALLVIANICLMSCKGKAKQLQRELLTYYENNSKRMKYKTYRDKGLLIGSGAMEAAHRHVIQQRMKLSGQRWTIAGAQQVANVRVADKSGEWDKILNLINLN